MNLDPTKVPNSNAIKNIIFDWGGVISNIDYHKTVDAFKEMGLDNFDELFTQLKQTELFDKLETGIIEPPVFHEKIRELIPNNPSDEEIDVAWTAMLLDLPKERLTLLEKVKENYQTYLLSNTNIIHVTRYSKYVDEIYGFENFRSLFKKVYYSHEVKMRKPHIEIFKLVLNENGLDAKETLFIDDTLQHVEGARKAGIQAFHLKKPLQIIEIFTHGKD